MNPKFWDLAYVAPEVDISGVLDAFRDRGFAVLEMTEEEVDKEVRRVPLQQRFNCRELWDCGVESWFLPKNRFNKKG